ncbi:unnamed protein product, partial [Symbiodinium necroappetens]
LNSKRPAESLHIKVGESLPSESTEPQTETAELETESAEPQTDAAELQNQSKEPHTETAEGDPKADFVTTKTLRRVIEELLRGRSLEKLTFGAFLSELTDALKLDAGDLADRRSEVKVILHKVTRKELQRQLVEHVKKKRNDASTAEVPVFSKVETAQVLLVYVVTFATPTDAEARRRLESFSRADLCTMMRTSLETAQAGRAEEHRAVVEKCTIFLERGSGAAGHHAHVAIKVTQPTRWKPWNDAIFQACGLVANFSSCIKGGYHNAVRYGFVPRPGKALEDLDPEPFTYPDSHPPLAEAMHRNFNSDAWADETLAQTQSRLSRGKSAPRFGPTDLWPVLVKLNLRPEDPAYEAQLFQYAKQSGGAPMIDYLVRNHDTLKGLGQKLWLLQEAENHVIQAKKSRLKFLLEATERSCVCAGRWGRAARQNLEANEISEEVFTKAIYDALQHGRAKGHTIALLGVGGNEGKTFLLSPMKDIYPPGTVIGSPSPSAFPLLELCKSRVAIWDDWRFDAAIIPIALQLQLFEGLAVTVNRPQNQFSGHEIWQGSTPFFLTGRLDDLMMVKAGVSCTDLTMLRKRLKVFEFKRSQTNPDITIPRCASCFAKMVLRKGNPRNMRFITPDLQEQAPGEVVVDYF